MWVPGLGSPARGGTGNEGLGPSNSYPMGRILELGMLLHSGLWELMIQITRCTVSSGEDPRILELRKIQIIQTPGGGGSRVLGSYSWVQGIRI